MSVEHTADVNALMSALAQASAALIAIVGGLLVSRYVTLHAEQQGARRRLDDIDRRIAASEASYSEAVLERDTYLVDDVLEDDRVYEEIRSSNGEPTVQGVLKALDHDGGGLNKEVLETRLIALVQEFGRAITEMYEVVPEAVRHDEWSDFRREHEFEMAHKDVWEWMYAQIREEKAEAARKAQAARRAEASGPFALLRNLPSYDVATYAQLAPLPLSSAQYQVRQMDRRAYRDRLRAAIDDAAAETRALHHERQLVQETYDATRQPEGFKLALQVLSVLAVLGMGVPVAVMAVAPAALPTLSRIFVVVTVMLGVALLLRYLFVYAGYLRDGGREDLPTNMLGLIPWPRRAQRRLSNRN